MGVVIHFPGAGCPKCAESVLDGRDVKVIDWRTGQRGGITKYRCSCGYEFWRYWPKVGEMEKAARKRLLEG